MTNAFTFSLAGQDITPYVQWLDDPSADTQSLQNAQPVKIDSVLGQGAGNAGNNSGRSATATFLTTLGPIGTALGAGQSIPPSTLNLFSAQQSDIETSDLSGFGGFDFTLTQDTTQAWQGGSSIKGVSAGSNGFEYLKAPLSPSALVAGQTYTLSCYVRGSGGTVRFFFDSSTGAVSSVLTITPTVTWTRYSVTFTVPNPWTATTCNLRFDTGSTAHVETLWLDGLQLEESSTATPWHLGGTQPLPSLVRQGEIIITDNTSGLVVFGGYVGDLQDASNRTRVYTQVNCYDYWQQLAKINVNQVYDGVTDLYVIRNLFSTYAPWVDLSLLPAYPAGQILGQVWRNKTLQWCIQHVADITGYQVYITPTRQLVYNTPTQAYPAPFGLSTAPDNSSTFPFKSESVEIDDTAIINRVTLYGGKQPTPDFVQDISSQANGNNKVFVAAYYMRKGSNGAVTVTVGGTDQVVGYALGTGAANTLKSQGGSCDCLLDPSARTITFDVAPGAGVQVLITYRYQIPLIIQLTNQQSYAFYGKYFDGTISDETVVDTATAIKRCQVVLLESAFGLTTIKLWMWKAGLQAGMQLHLTDTLRGLNNNYIIQEVVGQPKSPTTVEYEVTLGAWNWNLVDVLQAVAQRTAVTDTNEVETTTPVQVNLPAVASRVAASSLTLGTHAMGSYSPGVTGTVPGGFSV